MKNCITVSYVSLMPVNTITSK